MLVDYKTEFKAIRKGIKQVFSTWVDRLRDFKEITRTLVTVRAQRQGINYSEMEKNPLRERLENIMAFRFNHHKLQ